MDEYLIANSDMYKDFKANCNLSKVNVEELYQIIIGQGDSLKDTETSIDKLTNVNYVLYLKEYQIPISKYGINLFSNYQYEVKK